MLCASWRHRNSTVAAISDGSDIRPLGCFSASSARIPASRSPPLASARAAICGSISGVSTQPGQTQLTVTPPLSRLPAAATSSAATLLSPTRPNLLATYGDLFTEATRPCTDAMLSTRPKLRPTMPGRARRMVWKAALRLMAISLSQVAAGISPIGAVCCTPAQLTTMSAGPQSDSACIIVSMARASARSAPRKVASGAPAWQTEATAASICS